MRKLLLIGGGVVLLLVVVLVALALLVDADRFRPEAEARASDALGRQVTIGKLKLALFTGGVTAENLVIADDPQFSKDPFLSAGSMNIGVDLKALIFSRKLNVHSFLIHAPKLRLVQNQQGEWNSSSLAKKNAATKAPAPAGGAPLEFTVGKFTLDDGQVLVHHLASGKTSEYSKLRLEATDVSLASSFPYEFSATVPGGGTVVAKGSFGPIAQQSERTPMSAAITVKDFDIAATGFSDPASPLTGRVDVDATMKSDGTRTDVDAKITGNKMCMAAGCTPSARPIGINLTAGYLLADELANLSSGQIKVGSSAANLSGTIDLKGAKPQINARIDAARFAVSDLQSALPALGIVLPPGAKLEGGTASVKATAVGPAEALIIKGHVLLIHSKVTGYDLASKLSDITRFSGITVGKETVIQEFSSEVLHRPTGTKMDNVRIVLPGLARLTGAGTVGPRNDLNFAMIAHVNISKSAVGMIGSAFGRKNTIVDVPIHITGTTWNPKFTSDRGATQALKSTGNLAGSAGKGIQGLTHSLGGLFGKKK
jgi:AsmA protein